MAVPVRMELVADVSGLEDRLRRSVLRLAREKRQHLEGLGRGLRGPREQLEMARQRFDDIAERLPRALAVGVTRQRSELEKKMARFSPSLLQREAKDYRRRIDDVAARLQRAIRQRPTDAVRQLQQPAKLLESLSYRNVLARGFAVIYDAEGRAIKSAAGMAPGAAVAIEMQAGRQIGRGHV